jgi:dipeptidase E
MRLLLCSGGLRTPQRLEAFRREMDDHLGAAIRRVVFVPYALADHDGYVAAMIERGVDAGRELVGIHRLGDPVAAVHAADAVLVGGGNTFRLVDALQRLGLLGAIRERVLGGMPYAGISAGTNVACPTMMTTNDMPIVQPRSFEALGLVPFQINAHYYEGSTWLREGDGYVEHFGETRRERIEQFHEHESRPVVGLYEGAMIRRDGARLWLTGGGAVLFRRGAQPEALSDGARLEGLLA